MSNKKKSPTVQKLHTQQRTLANQVADTLIVYVKTQFVVVLSVTVLSWIILSWLGVAYAGLLACMTGALSTIPMLGMIVAAILTALVATLDNMRFLPNVAEILEGIVIVGVYIVFNFIIDWILAPYLTGKMVKVHPFLILLVVILGSATLGVVGAFLAVPALLVVKTILEYSEKEKSKT
jgi:predicted PurR-regulated permease PerM